eukprot:g3238.t1
MANWLISSSYYTMALLLFLIGVSWLKYRNDILRFTEKAQLVAMKTKRLFVRGNQFKNRQASHTLMTSTDTDKMNAAKTQMTPEEQLEDLTRRFQLLEGERKATYETAQLNIRQNKEIIKQMKVLNCFDSLIKMRARCFDSR